MTHTSRRCRRFWSVVPTWNRSHSRRRRYCDGYNASHMSSGTALPHFVPLSTLSLGSKCRRLHTASGLPRVRSLLAYRLPGRISAASEMSSCWLMRRRCLDEAAQSRRWQSSLDLSLRVLSVAFIAACDLGSCHGTCTPCLLLNIAYCSEVSKSPTRRQKADTRVGGGVCTAPRRYRGARASLRLLNSGSIRCGQLGVAFARWSITSTGTGCSIVRVMSTSTPSCLLKAV